MEGVADVKWCRFVVEDKKYNYISARFPGDIEMLAKKAVGLVKVISS